MSDDLVPIAPAANLVVPERSDLLPHPEQSLSSDARAPLGQYRRHARKSTSWIWRPRAEEGRVASHSPAYGSLVDLSRARCLTDGAEGRRDVNSAEVMAADRARWVKSEVVASR